MFVPTSTFRLFGLGPVAVHVEVEVVNALRVLEREVDEAVAGIADVAAVAVVP